MQSPAAGRRASGPGADPDGPSGRGDYLHEEDGRAAYLPGYAPDLKGGGATHWSQLRPPGTPSSGGAAARRGARGGNNSRKLDPAEVPEDH